MVNAWQRVSFVSTTIPFGAESSDRAVPVSTRNATPMDAVRNGCQVMSTTLARQSMPSQRPFQ